MKKLYETDSYLRECDTLVVSCTPGKSGFCLELEENLFFPEEGGQYADTGRLIPLGKEGQPEGDPVYVLDGKLQKDGRILYHTETALPAGTRVHCILDWEKRFSRMQQHTGEHILTGRIHSVYGYSNVGFHLSDEGLVTLDLSGPLTVEQAMEMEVAANRVVWENLPVQVLFPSREELESLPYRSKKEIEGQVRLIAIGEKASYRDLCACCAPHTARTGEVGSIRILSVQNYKGGTRLGILCGLRALEHGQREWKRFTDLAKSLSTGVEDVADSVAGLQQDLMKEKGRVAVLQEQGLLRDFRDIPEGEPAILFTEGPLAPVALKNSFNTMAGRAEGYVGIFQGSDENGYTYTIGSTRLDTRPLGLLMKEELGARGGGSREMVTGRTSAPRKEIEAFWRRAAMGGTLAQI